MTPSAEGATFEMRSNKNKRMSSRDDRQIKVFKSGRIVFELTDSFESCITKKFSRPSSGKRCRCTTLVAR